MVPDFGSVTNAKVQMRPALNADSRNGLADPATVSSQTDAASVRNEAAAAAGGSVDEIHDFYLSAGDRIDLRNVAAHFGLSPDAARDALTFVELSGGTELSIEAQGTLHKIAVIHGVVPAVLCRADPWIFEDRDAADIRETRDGVLPDCAPPPDAFIFQVQPKVSASPIIDQFRMMPDVKQVALVLGLPEAQVIDAIRDAHLTDTADVAGPDAVAAGNDAFVL